MKKLGHWKWNRSCANPNNPNNSETSTANVVNDLKISYFALDINKIIDQTDRLVICIRKFFGAPPAWMFCWPITNWQVKWSIPTTTTKWTVVFTRTPFTFYMNANHSRRFLSSFSWRCELLTGYCIRTKFKLRDICALCRFFYSL